MSSVSVYRPRTPLLPLLFARFPLRLLLGQFLILLSLDSLVLL